MTDLIQRAVKVLVLFVVGWVLLWAFNNLGCHKIEGTEMSPAIGQNEFKIVLTQKRRPEDLQHDDIVAVEYQRADLPQQTFAARVFGKPGDLIWVERKFVARQLQVEAVEARRDRPSKEEEGRFLPMVVPRDSYFLLCDNKLQYVLYDSRGIGPVGIWALKGKVRN